MRPFDRPTGQIAEVLNVSKSLSCSVVRTSPSHRPLLRHRQERMSTTTRLVEANDVIHLRKDPVIGDEGTRAKGHLISPVLQGRRNFSLSLSLLKIEERTDRTVKNSDVCRAFEEEGTDLLTETQQVDQTRRMLLVGQRQIDHLFTRENAILPLLQLSDALDCERSLSDSDERRGPGRTTCTIENVSCREGRESTRPTAVRTSPTDCLSDWPSLQSTTLQTLQTFLSIPHRSVSK